MRFSVILSGLVILATLALLSRDHERAMEMCEARYSRSTCLHSLR